MPHPIWPPSGETNFLHVTHGGMVVNCATFSKQSMADTRSRVLRLQDFFLCKTYLNAGKSNKVCCPRVNCYLPVTCKLQMARMEKNCNLKSLAKLFKVFLLVLKKSDIYSRSLISIHVF